MKIKFELPKDNNYHQYCLYCNSESIKRVFRDNKTYYYCEACHQENERSLVIDPEVKWWTDENKEYWHESIGVFIKNPDGKFLFFERNIFPFSYTIPSGHVDFSDRSLKVAAVREVQEETTLELNIDDINELASEDIWGDSCRRGADVHKWHAFMAHYENNVQIKIIDEGLEPTWLSLEEALTKKLTVPVKYIIEKYSNELWRF